MNKQTKTLFFLSVLAMIFTAGLTFASIELPRILDEFLATTIHTPDVATGASEMSEWKTNLYLQYYHLRLIGYCCLILIVILIAVGFVTERTGWTSTGALLLFLPVFGHFAATMFFLGGLGFLRLLWLPALDVSFNLFRLADIINVPYTILQHLDSFVGINLRWRIAYGIVALGLLIFFLGTVTWFYARMQKREVADFWVYRFSRHPQYLGWIVWSYGVLYLPGSNIRLCYGLSGSLPWLLSTMIIVGVAMLEEIKMSRAYGEVFETYRRCTPFLFPTPRWMTRLFTFPLRLMTKKEYPDRKREVVAVLAFYTCLCLGVSLLYGEFDRSGAGKRDPSPQRIEELVRVMREADNFGEKRRAAAELGTIGEPAIESLVVLLNDPVPQIRAYAADALGGMKSERAIDPLMGLLHDNDPYVRRTAAGALGRIGSPRRYHTSSRRWAIPKPEVVGATVRALGGIHHPDVIPHLIRALGDTTLNAIAPAAAALGERALPEAVEPLIRCFEEIPACPYDVVGEALWKLHSDRAVDAWIVGLRKGRWWYPRTSCAASLGRVKSERGIEPLMAALHDGDEKVRRAAVLGLMEIGSEKARGALEEAMGDEDFEVRIYATEALRRINTSGVHAPTDSLRDFPAR